MNEKVEAERVEEIGNNFLIYRYFDDKNQNYEYQTYKLVKSKSVAREFGISDMESNRKTSLNTRDMCDKMIKSIVKEEESCSQD